MKALGKGHMTFRMLSIKKETAFLFVYLQNIRYLGGTSDITTIINDQGNILQISRKT